MHVVICVQVVHGDLLGMTVLRKQADHGLSVACGVVALWRKLQVKVLP
jgi:hypothetical protein